VNTSSKLKSALVVVGGSLAASPATALEIGDAKVHSTLGQPLRASIAYALGPNEMISDSCVSLQPMMNSGGVPSINHGSLVVADGVIAITGSSIMREPLVSMRVTIDCHYTPRLARDYLMFINPTGVSVIAAPTPERVATQPQLDAQRVIGRRPAAERPRSVIGEPIAEATRFQAPPGATLGEIAQQVENRPAGVWKTANLIFEMNPGAFIDNDPNKLKAGSWLMIPSFGADASVTLADAALPAMADPVVPPAGSAVYEPVNIRADTVQAETEAQSSESPLVDLQPGDLIIDANNPYVAPVRSTSTQIVVIPDTRLEGPQTTSTSPNVPVAVIRQATESETSTSKWLWWLGGGGVAIILALVLFGRRFRDGFGSSRIAPAVPQRRETDGETQNLAAVGEIEVDIFEEPTAGEGLTIDADLIIGTGLQRGTEVDVAEDFCFASTTALDLELTEEMSGDGAISETDILPPLRADDQSILKSEVMPEDDEYDISVIVDATKMPSPDDITQRDLEAVQVDDGDETLITGDYTVSQEVDYKIVEQDYEDEMTATQALSAEIMKAADELTVSLDEANQAADAASDLPLATVHELDITSQMPVQDQNEIGDDEDTGVNPTINMEADNDTIEMPKGGKKTG
jgi:hypothetical protein